MQGTGTVAVQHKRTKEQPVPAQLAAAAEQLPLPPVLERLNTIFRALNLVYTLLLNNHIQASAGCMGWSSLLPGLTFQASDDRTARRGCQTLHTASCFAGHVADSGNRPEEPRWLQRRLYGRHRADGAARP